MPRPPRTPPASSLQPPACPQFTLRTVIRPPELPQWAVTAVYADHTGLDVAWFFYVSDARQYILWRSRRHATASPPRHTRD